MSHHVPYEELLSEINGDLYTDKLMRTMLSTDAGLYQVEPKALVYPKSKEDVATIVRFASKYGLTVHPRGAGSGLCGSAIGSGIIVDFTKYMNKLTSYDPDTMLFTCEPGYRYGELEQMLTGSGLFFPPAPSSGEYASFGGMYGTNAGGAYSVKYGNVADYLVDAEVVFADGEIRTLNNIASMDYNELPTALKELYTIIHANKKNILAAYPDVPCNVCGYELRYVASDGHLYLHKLIGGAEGTLGIVTSLTFRLVRKPKYSSLIVAYFSDIVSTAKAAQLAIPRKPSGIEIMDKSLLRVAVEHEPSLRDKIPQGYDNVSMIEFESDDAEELSKITHACMHEIQSQKLSPEIYIAMSAEEAAQFWAIRKAAVPILYLMKGDKKIIPLVEDAAVPSDRLVAYFHGIYKIFEDYGVDFVTYGHIAKGLLHTRPLINMKDKHDINLLKPIADDMFHLVRGLGGTISGEHGDGRLRSSYIPLQYSDIYELFLYVKKLLDPKSLFNPDVKTNSNPSLIFSDLRYGSTYKAREMQDKLLIWHDGIAVEVERCHGCSKCTTVTRATRMCPVYKANRDEFSAPKAKANILRALISGRIEDSELFAEGFKHVIDRCINCGSCSYECPSHVNIPKLALEARSQYVRMFGVPLEYKIITNFENFAKYTRKIFPLISPLMKFKFMRKAAEKIAGITSKREFVKFRASSLFDKFGAVIGNGEKKALYFTGCYAAYIRPEIGESTIRVMNRMGYTVLLPDQHCCGIPHLSKGMADNARIKIEDNLKNWGGLLDEIDVIVVSCSSCGLSLIKEWGYYMGGELVERVKRMTVHVSELINNEMGKLPAAEGLSAAYHTSCHMKLMPAPEATWKMLSSIDGLNAVKLKSGCCGMAGSWGLSSKHYEESMAIGSDMLNNLESSGCTICVTDCPTCEMQLKHMSDKPVFHPVEIVDKILMK